MRSPRAQTCGHGRAFRSLDYARAELDGSKYWSIFSVNSFPNRVVAANLQSKHHKHPEKEGGGEVLKKRWLEEGSAFIFLSHASEKNDEHVGLGRTCDIR